MQWLGALEASFDAGLTREEDAAAEDLAFSLRQDVDVRDGVTRRRTGWTLVGGEGTAAQVDEVGADYLRAGDVVVRSECATLRSTTGPAPRTADRTFLELLGAACRAGVEAHVGNGIARGRLVRVAKDHVAIRNGDVETIVGLAAVETVRLVGYSDSRGFSG